jgi:hypothetical protein
MQTVRASRHGSRRHPSLSIVLFVAALGALTAAALVAPGSAAAQAHHHRTDTTTARAPRGVLEIPRSLREEHAELHARLVAATEVPGRVGEAARREADVQFRAISPDGFAAFNDPGFVKIVVAISVESVGLDSSTARVHTRVATTDATARARFRRYWAAFSPGILLIRRATLHEVKREAERRNTGIADERGPRSSSPPRQQARSAR